MADDELKRQVKQLWQQAVKVADTARVEAGRYAQGNRTKIDSAIDRTAQAVGRKTGKDYGSTAAKVKGAAAKGAARLAGDPAPGSMGSPGSAGSMGSAGPGSSYGQAGGVTLWPDAGGPSVQDDVRPRTGGTPGVTAPRVEEPPRSTGTSGLG